MTTRDKIEERLNLHVLNIGLASVAGREGDLRTAKALLIDEVLVLIREAEQVEALS